MKTFFTQISAPKKHNVNYFLLQHSRTKNELQTTHFQYIRKNKQIFVKNACEIVANVFEPEGTEFVNRFIYFSEDKYFSLIADKLLIDKKKNDSFALSAIQLVDLKQSFSLHKDFKEINNALFFESIFVGFVNKKNQWENKFSNKLFFPLNWLINVFFGLKQFLGQVIFGKKSTRKYNKISKAELFGRLTYAGFEILSELETNTKLLFAAKKVSNAPENEIKQGIFIQLNRVGKEGKMVDVYKVRSMYPYSEFLQEYIYKTNHLDVGGKFKDDFRISKIGKFIRKTWIDELPMLYNLLRGDLKLVGVRPLSKQYFSLYPTELQNLRTKSKPGLIPPFYVDMPKTLQEIIDSELKYLKLYEKSPFKTDFIYFFKALKNILFKGKRSH